MDIPNKTLDDLEFQHVRNKLEEYANSEQIKSYFQKLKPLGDHAKCLNRLQCTNELLSGMQRSNRFPVYEFLDITEYIPKLSIEGFVLPVEVCFEISNQNKNLKRILNFLKEFEEYFPVLFEKSEGIVFEKEISRMVDKIFEKSGEIKNDASPELFEIRKESKRLEGSIQEKFRLSLKKYSEHLDEIRESYISNVRVLAVKSAKKRQVPGRILGTSKTGSISFIEPSNVAALQQKYDHLKDDERNEIRKILLNLTVHLSVFSPEIKQTQNFLLHLDMLNAQAQYANLIHATLPKLSENLELKLIEAYHPILFEQSLEVKQKVLPQSLTLDKDNRILLISGPNAGGKSITLKTIGLLQLMIQSGLLIPVNPKSTICFFEKIFTDIGDNQSIENQLSTYSYRLKQMNFFIRNMDSSSLLLIDEFGTGSDPELGGALAEVFLEDVYEKGVFSVLTTHYTNIKVRVEQLEAAQNACMLFDENTLEPLFQLEVGQAGSSFTFEVARKNKIPFSLINRAKKKVENNTIRLDKTIAKLQREKTEISKTKDQLQKLRQESKKKNISLEDTQEKIKKKLLDFQSLYDKNQKYLQLGKKIDEIADDYHINKSRRKTFAKVLKLLETENAKKPQNQKQQKRKEQKIERTIKTELKKNTSEIKDKLQKQEIIEKKNEQKKLESFEVGQRVRIKDSVSVGRIESIEKEKVTINYGKFLTRISIHDLEKV